MPASSLNVLAVHAAYQQRGGEDAVAESEIALLRAHGHRVDTYQRDNAEADSLSAVDLAMSTVWSRRTEREVSALIEARRPDVIHAHNTFPLISPSLYWVAARHGIPVVQTLHNFRLGCLNAFLLREGRNCEDCVGRLPWRGVVHGCYRGSRPVSAVLAGSLAVHRGLGTFNRKVARYIALNDFTRQKFIEMGLPAGRVVVKPNFIDFPEPTPQRRDNFLFVGRLSLEKGITTLAAAHALTPDVHLRVAGDGPERATLNDLERVERLGLLSPDLVREEMNRAAAVVIPSIWYENFPRTLVEAFACATPVIASRIGALATLVEDGRTGLLFEPGNAQDLSAKLAWAHAHPQRMAAMGQAARQRYLADYSPEVNYRRLIEIYREAIDEKDLPQAAGARRSLEPEAR